MASMTSTEVDRRLTDLEIKVSFTEDALDRLNDVVVRQQRQIELLTRELVALRERRASDDAPTVRSLRDDLPPHY
jgi:SlyX protein